MPGVNTKPLRDGVKSLHVDQEYSDLVIKRGSKEWKVHKAIVCPQSTFFKKACNGDWLEARKGIVELHDESEALVEQLIRFLYLSTYEDELSKDDSNTDGPLVFNVKMFAAADKFEIPGLDTLATDNFLLQLPSRLESLAEKQDFMRAVYELYQDAPARGAEEMRQKVIETATSNAYDLFNTKAGSEEDAVSFAQLVRDIPEFGDEVMVRMSAAFAKLQVNSFGTSTYRCDGCPCNFTVTYGRPSKDVKCPYCLEQAKFLY